EFITTLRSSDFVESVSPVINTFGLVKSESSSRNAALGLMGIVPETHIKTTDFAKSLYFHKDTPSLAFAPSYNTKLPGCVIGVDLLVERDQWGNYMQWPYLPRWSYGITCFPLTPKGTLVKAGISVSANTKTFYYSDNANTGLAKIDSTMVYLPFEQLQSLTGMDIGQKRTSAIFIKFRKGFDIDKSAEKTAALWKEFVEQKSDSDIAGLFKTVNVQDFRSYRRESIAPMEKERAMLLMLFLLVGLITVFIIFVIFYMIVGAKNKDIGILKSVGASGFGIMRVFLRYAVLTGIVGAIVGIACALIFLDNINSLENWLYDKFGFQMWNREIYAIGEIPNRPGVALPVEVAAAAIVACLLGAMLPTVRAARQNCVDILRVNQI
ncbi:MAG: FtsX-like permease family protein, partial [Planctomycetes bacterium]|nr:FtsX-like permease family protein [Planctomycetota bacterium]